MNIYLQVLAITAILAVIFINNRKGFVISAALVHAFVESCRYMYMHGDLRKYAADFYETVNWGWGSDEILRGGRNTLFYMLSKYVSEKTDGDFQVLLIIIAIISILSISVVIYRYSPMPFVSFWFWSCFGFYIFSFYSIKQALAMAFVMFSSIAIFEKKRLWFYLLILIAGFCHLPAFVFLPAYEICNMRRTQYLFSIYTLAFLVIFVRKNQIVSMMADVYYDSDKYEDVALMSIGGKTIMMIMLLFVGYQMLGMTSDYARKTLILMAAATLLQIFSVYDNVFTRLADYYFQFIILFAPMMLKQYHEAPEYPKLFFEDKSQRILAVIFCMLALVFYYRVNLANGGGPESPDNLIQNFAFMWQIVE